MFCSCIFTLLVYRVFDPRRQSADNPKKVKASCSELLGVYGLLRHFVECNLMRLPGLVQHIDSFLAACRSLDLLLAAKHVLADPSELGQALERQVSQYIVLHKAAYGTALMKPKFHWALDVPSQICRDRMVLDAFVIERTHLRVKAVAEHVRNTVSYERSVMASLATVCWQHAETDEFGNCLLGTTAPLTGIHGAWIADRMQVWSVEFSIDDMVSKSGGQVGSVVACCSFDGRLFALVRPAVVASRPSDHSVLCRPSGDLEAWPERQLMLSLAWRSEPDGSILVIV